MNKTDYSGLFKEQVEVISHDGGNILVSASAGSGKTFVMIKRLVRLIAEGKAKINEILAVTFTEAAAKEMKEKLADDLFKSIDGGASFLAEQAANLPYADVCTIDSFCARIVRLYFYKAGTSPDFSVADAATSERLKSDAIDKTFREFYRNGDADFKLLAERFSKRRNDDELKRYALSCYEYISTEKDPTEFKNRNLDFYTDKGFTAIKECYLKSVFKKLKAIKSDLSVLREKLSAKGYKKGAAKAGDLISAIDNMLSLNSPYELKNAVIKVGNFDSNPDEDGKILKKELEVYKNKTDDIIKFSAEYFADEEKDASRLPSLYNSVAAFYRIIDRFSVIYAQEKSEENVLDFNDLERFALIALNDGDVAAEIRNKYKYVFVDEYQDVNGIQEAIINLVANGNEFMVGDVKQSIYGFRGCRSDFFEKKYARMESDGESVKKLNKNFRSSDAVINAVNGVFSYSMTEEVYGGSYEGQKLERGNLYPENSGRFKVIRFSEDEIPAAAEERLGVYDVIKSSEKLAAAKKISKEARVIAGIILREIKKTYYDVKTKQERPVKLKDIAILSRVGAEYSGELIDGLNALGVPVSTDGDVSVLPYAEVSTLVALLKILRNFYDDVSLATVMKSPFGNFTDEELTEIALSYYDGDNYERGTGFSYAVKNCENLTGDLKEKTESFKKFIEDARYAADFLSAGEILERLIENKNYYAFLSACENGEEKTERVKFFVRKAFDGKKYSVSEFVSLTETAAKAFKTGGGKGGDAVKFMTIHASKGLEYPVAILRGAEKIFDSPEELDDKILKDREFGFAFDYYDDSDMRVERTPYTGLIKSRIKANAVPEELRLFYVALTRAEYALYLTYKLKVKQETGGKSYNGLLNKRAVAHSYVNFLPNAINVEDASESDVAIFGEESERRAVIFPTVKTETIETLKERYGFSYPFTPDTLTPLKISVTAAMKDGVINGFNSGADIFGNAENGLDETDAERGNIAHKIMEYYDFDAFPNVKEFTAGLVDRGVILDEDAKKIDLEKLSRAIFGGAFDGVRGKKLFREKNFIVGVEGRLVSSAETEENVVMQGKIDLLCVDDDGAVIYDYKYSAKNGQVLKERYKKQLDLYAYAVEKSLKIKVKGKYIISLLTGETVKID